MQIYGIDMSRGQIASSELTRNVGIEGPEHYPIPWDASVNVHPTKLGWVIAIGSATGVESPCPIATLECPADPEWLSQHGLAVYLYLTDEDTDTVEALRALGWILMQLE